MNRREFVLGAAAVALAPDAAARRLGGTSTALVTADLESHVVAVDLASGRVVRRIPTDPGPRAIERVLNDAVVCHTEHGLLTIVDGARMQVRGTLGGFREPRYAAAWNEFVFVTDSAGGQLVAVHVPTARIVGRLEVGGAPRHLSFEPSGRVAWVVLGNKADRIAVVDVGTPSRMRLLRRFVPPFLAHDVGFGPGRVWVTGGDSRELVVYGGNSVLRLRADAPPQHVTFLGRRAFVSSGDSGTLRVHDARTGALLRTARIPLGSYNVDRTGGHVHAVTPSLTQGTLCVADGSGRIVRRVRVARSSHDACVVVTP